MIFRPLSSSSELTKLDLSNNEKITANAHQHLSQLKNLKELDLNGCEILLGPCALSLPFCQLSLSSEVCGENFKEAPYNFVTNMNEVVF